MVKKKMFIPLTLIKEQDNVLITYTVIFVSVCYILAWKSYLIATESVSLPHILNN